METFQTASSDPQLDFSRLLPREVFRDVILTLRAALPRPLTESAEDGVLRDRAALAAVAALLPETAAEGRLAAQFVAADTWAMDCFRLAYERQREPRIADRCRAQAMGMMREGKSALKALEKLQAQRRAMAKDAAAAERADWVEHAAVGMMAEALETVGVRGGTSLTHASEAQGGRKLGLVPTGENMAVETCSETQARLSRSRAECG